MSKEQQILSKLFKIAESQQKMLTKIAQATEPGHVPLFDYINRRLVSVVAGNMGLSHVTSQCSTLEGGTAGAVGGGAYQPKDPDSIRCEIYGVPEAKRSGFVEALNRQLQIQKPELVGKVSFWFPDSGKTASSKLMKKLAAIVGMDPNIEYLLSAIPTAAANAGINNVVVSKVEPAPGGTSGSGAHMEAGYTAFIRGVPGKAGDMFKNTWDKQLAAQKPDLVGRVSFIFEG